MKSRLHGILLSLLFITPICAQDEIPPANPGISDKPLSPGQRKLEGKLGSVLLPHVEFMDATVEECVAYFKRMSVELDSAEPNPAKRGLEIIIKAPPGDPPAEQPAITLNLSNVSLYDAIQKFAALANKKITFGPDAIYLLEDTDLKLIKAKLQLMVPQIDVKETTVREAMDWLVMKSIQLDTKETDPLKKGVNIVVKYETIPGITGIPPSVPGEPPPAPQLVAPSNAKITLKLKNIPLLEDIRYVASLAGMKYTVEPHAVVVEPLYDSPPAPVDDVKTSPAPATEDPQRAAPDPLAGKLTQIVIPKVGFKEASVQEALQWLEKQSMAHDPAKQGVHFRLDLAAAANKTKLNFFLNNIPLSETIRYITSFAGLRAAITSDGILILPDSAKLPEGSAPLVYPAIPQQEASLAAKLQGIIIPKAEFKEATVREATGALLKIGPVYDNIEKDPAKQGVNILIWPGLPPGTGEAASTLPAVENKVTLLLRDAPIGDVLRYIAKVGNMKIRIDPCAVVFLPLTRN